MINKELIIESAKAVDVLLTEANEAACQGRLTRSQELIVLSTQGTMLIANCLEAAMVVDPVVAVELAYAVADIIGGEK